MPSTSVSQQQAAGVALSAKRGKIPASELFGAAKTMYDSMSTGELEKFASTKHDGLPDKAECTEPTAQTIAETIMGLAEEKKADYKIFFSNALKKFGVTSVKKLSGDSRKKFFKYVDDNWKALDETSSSGGAGAYLTPRAFTGGTEAGKKKQKQTAELLGYKLVNNEGIFDRKEKTPAPVTKKTINFEPFDNADIQILNANVGKGKTWILGNVFGQGKQINLSSERGAGSIYKVNGKYYLISMSEDSERHDGANNPTYKFNSLEDLFNFKTATKVNDIGENSLTESFYFKDESLTAEQKMNLAVRQIRNNLYEVEKLVGKTLRLKNESGVKSEEYGKRTYSALRRINEKVIRLMGSLQNFK